LPHSADRARLEPVAKEPATVETIAFGLWPAPSKIDGEAWPASLKHPELVDIIVGTLL
jgi:hypothetical protein